MSTTIISMQFTVPDVRVPEAIEFFNSLMPNVSIEEVGESIGEVVNGSEGREWSEETWRGLWSSLTPELRQVWLALDEEPTSFDAWAESLGLTSYQLRGRLSGFTRNMHRYTEQTEWPVQMQRDPETRRITYSLSATQKAIIASL